MRIFLEESKVKHARNTGNFSRKTVFYFSLDCYLYKYSLQSEMEYRIWKYIGIFHGYIIIMNIC